MTFLNARVLSDKIYEIAFTHISRNRFLKLPHEYLYSENYGISKGKFNKNDK